MTRINSGVRWRDDVGWELRCLHCPRGTVYWPLTDEFWDKKRLTRCRACWRAHERSRLTAQQREARREYARQWRERNPGYNAELMRVKRRLFPDEKKARAATYYWNNRERILAQQREYKARQRDKAA